MTMRSKFVCFEAQVRCGSYLPEDEERGKKRECERKTDVKYRE